MSRVRFIRAPRGDAVVPPPAVGPQSVLGTSQRAAREDHTHEGVHRIVAGAGVAITPSSGLGDVTLEVLHWRPPVQFVIDLPPTGNQPGDARVVLSEAAIYVWTGAVWQKVTADGGGNGGGGDGGDTLGGILDILYTNMRLAKSVGVPAYALYRSVIDVFASEAGIDPNRSTNVRVYPEGVSVASWDEVVLLDREPAGWSRQGSGFVFQGGYMTLNSTAAAAYWYKTNPNPSSEYTLEAVLLSVNAGSDDFDNCIVVETTFGRAWIEAFPNQVRLRGATLATLDADMTQPHVVTLHHVGDGVFRGYLDGTLIGEVTRNTYSNNRLLFGDGSASGQSNSTWQLVRHKVGGPPIGDSGTVVSVAHDFGFVPSRLYLAALDDPGSGAIRYYASRDDGETWLPVEKDGVVDFTGYPVGTKVRVRADLEGVAAIHAWGWTVV